MNSLLVYCYISNLEIFLLILPLSLLSLSSPPPTPLLLFLFPLIAKIFAWIQMDKNEALILLPSRKVDYSCLILA